MMPPALRRTVLAACLAGFGVAAGAEPVHADKAADKHPPKHAARHKATKATHTQAQAQAQAHAHKPAHASAHASAHAAPDKPPAGAAHVKPHKAAQKTAAHKDAHKDAHKPVQKPAHDTAARTAHSAQHAAHAAALAATSVPPPHSAKASHKPPAANADPDGDGFLNLYVELCVKRIGEIDAFRDKLLREKVPRLQPESAKAFLSGMAGDAWPVPYHGKMGNFVLVLPEQKNLCMLYARRTDTAAVEEGFTAMVAKAPEPMIARRGPESRAAGHGNGTHTLSTSWAPPGSERRMQFMLTTSSAPDAQVQAFGSVAIVVGPEPVPGPDKAGASPPLTRPSGPPGPAPRPRAQP